MRRVRRQAAAHAAESGRAACGQAPGTGDCESRPSAAPAGPGSAGGAPCEPTPPPRRVRRVEAKRARDSCRPPRPVGDGGGWGVGRFGCGIEDQGCFGCHGHRGAWDRCPSLSVGRIRSPALFPAAAYGYERAGLGFSFLGRRWPATCGSPIHPHPRNRVAYRRRRSHRARVCPHLHRCCRYHRRHESSQ